MVRALDKDLNQVLFVRPDGKVSLPEAGLASDNTPGVQTIAFHTGGWPDDALRGAVAIFDDPDDLVSHLADSPFADAAT